MLDDWWNHLSKNLTTSEMDWVKDHIHVLKRDKKQRLKQRLNINNIIQLSVLSFFFFNNKILRMSLITIINPFT